MYIGIITAGRMNENIRMPNETVVTTTTFLVPGCILLPMGAGIEKLARVRLDYTPPTDY
jgi:hypothetical protein